MIVTSGFYKEFEIDLTTSCNLRCPLCTRNYSHAQHSIDSKYKSGRLLIDITNQLDTFPNFNRCMLAGAISEPTLYKDLFGFIEYLNSRDIIIYLYVNGNTHDNEYWYELGKLSTESMKVFFTICGSTQELHEKYRVNSDLKTLLEHHDSFKRGSSYCNDYLQHIMFEYNRDDFKNMDYIRSLFSNEFNIESLPYRERFDVGDVPEDIAQRFELKEKYKAIQNIPKNKEDLVINCKSIQQHFISIDNKGTVSPCFLYRMYVGDSSWGLDYTDILKYKYDFCYECESKSCRLLGIIDGLEVMT